MSKFNIGDRVKVNSADWYEINKNENGYIIRDRKFTSELGSHTNLRREFSPKHKRFCGKTGIVLDISYDAYYIGFDEILAKEYIYDFALSKCDTEEPNECSALTSQVGGSYYKDMKIQPIEFIHANKLDFLQGNVIKYVCRHKNKNGKQDIEKAMHYLQLILDLEYSQQK